MKKRLIVLLPLLSLLLCGCGSAGQRLKSPVTFYYVMDQYPYGGSGGVIASEQREAAGHKDLSYLLALYMLGPSEEDLHSPIPAGTRVHYVKNNAAGITVSLSDTAESLSDSDFSLACACLTMTLLDMTSAERVTIQCGSRNVSMTRDSLILYDNTQLEETK